MFSELSWSKEKYLKSWVMVIVLSQELLQFNREWQQSRNELELIKCGYPGPSLPTLSLFTDLAAHFKRNNG